MEIKEEDYFKEKSEHKKKLIDAMYEAHKNRKTMKKSGLEWFINQVYGDMWTQDEDIEKLVYKARELEKQQIVDAYRVGKVEATLPSEKLTTGGKYYRELFKPE
jgi:hypothetical protein